MTARGLSTNKSPFCKNAIESIDTACPERLPFFVADVGVFLANRFLAVDTHGPDVKHYWWGAIKSVIMVSRAISINGSVALKKWGVAGQWHPPPRGVELERARSGERDETERDTRLTSGVKSSHLNHKKTASIALGYANFLLIRWDVGERRKINIFIHLLVICMKIVLVCEAVKNIT